MIDREQLSHDLRKVCASWAVGDFVAVADVLAAELLARGLVAGRSMARVSVELQTVVDAAALAHDVARALR